ncbi:hypothetical protein EG328_000875 [Venturia inaequalis]|uniref:Protein kinase domain-containing protein n=1 Tax=Venturia inaequalis TaxID=5025 RepID=A0A8H3YZ00_VENIN|nr:hypothetical protein EG328_000875 [Venturia inaequalis]
MKCHVLDFLCDSDRCCALTVLQNGIRFHIIANAEDFEEKDPGSSGPLCREYQRLVQPILDHEDTQLVKDDEDGDGAEEEEGNRSPASTKTSDSGVDMSRPDDDYVEHKGGFASEGDDAKKEMANWMLSSFTDIFEDMAPVSKALKQPTLKDWYNCPTHFFSIQIDKDQLVANPLEANKHFKTAMNDLEPRTKLPKYVTNLNIPRFSPEDLKVITESDELNPFHPSRVTTKQGETYFLKGIDATQPDATKRELKTLVEIEKKGLHKQINVPRVHGLVTSCHAPSEFIGFLLTDIPRPTPLIKLIDEDISQRKREKWAKEVERFTDVLHDNDIVWGDAKADNFVLDENEKLWIIDFGGNYTEGWVDAEKAETMEGDEQGIEKIVNALVDPIEGTEEIRSSQEAIDQERERGEKRRVDDDEEGEEDGGKPHGRRVRFKSSAKRNEELYSILTILFGLLLVFQTLASEVAPPIPGYGFEDFSWDLEVFPGRHMILNGTIQEAIAQAVQINPKFKFNNTVTASSDANTPRHTDWDFAYFHEILDAMMMLGNGKGEDGHGEDLPKGKPKLGPGPGNCGRVSCEGSSAIYWCNDSLDDKELSSYSDIANAAVRVTEYCPPFGGFSKVETKGQQFTNDQWNVIVRGDNCCRSQSGWQIC